MVRRKIAIKRIEENARRHTTFSKRRNGLMKKAMEYFQVSDSQGAIIAFSKSGNVFVFAHPDIDVVLDRYDAESSAGEAGSSGAGGTEEAAEAPMTEARKRIVEATVNGGWEEVSRDLGMKELNELSAEIEDVKRSLAREIEIAEAAAKDSTKEVSSDGDSSL